MLKKIVFPIISLFLAYQTFEIVKTLWYVEPAEFTLTIAIVLSFLLNLFITGFFAFLGFAYRTNQILGDHYYRVKNPTLIVRLSKILKIETFRKFLLVLFWGKKKNRQKYFDGTRMGLANFEYQTRQSEFGHLAALIVIQMVVFIILTKEQYATALITTLLNFISNFYPIVLQRNHRIQISRITNMLNRKSFAAQGL